MKTLADKPRHSHNGHNNHKHTEPAQALAEQIDDLQNDFEEQLSAEEIAKIWDERAYALAEVPPPPATGKTIEALLFWLGGERYGIDVGHVHEIYPLERFTPVPRTPNFVVGVFSARGQILSVIDLRAFLGFPKIGLSDQTKIIVVGSTEGAENGLQVGILADEVADVVTIFKDDIEPPLATHTGAHVEYIEGVTADLLMVLNLNALLADKKLIIHEELM